MTKLNSLSQSGRRKTFWKTFFASAALFFGGMKASAQSEGEATDTAPVVAHTDAKQLGRDLYDYAESFLVLNEGKHLSFYRCNQKKASVAIGCNIQDFSEIITELDIPIFKKTGKQTRRLTPLQRDMFFANLS